MYRIGIGYDFHRLAENRKLVLGGIEIPYNKGLLGHSDADVLTHAICDAILGAAALGDIGVHFPSSDPQYKDTPSMVFLIKVLELLTNAGYELVNLDCVLLAEEPKLSPFFKKMAERIAGVLGLDPSQVSIKATTTEGMGAIGRGEGISAQAIALIRRSEPL